MSHFEPTEGSLPAAGRAPEIFYRRWGPFRPRAAVIVVHGLGEHCGRYDNVVGALCPKGLAVYGLDLRGHGRSGGRRGHVSSFSEYLEDTEHLIAVVGKQDPDASRFLLGHSMGGLIALRYAISHPEGLSGLALSSASLKIKGEVPAIKVALGRLFSRILPAFTMNNGLDSRDVSRDPAVVKAYEDDPLVHHRVSARWYTEFVDAMAASHRDAALLEVPILILQAGDDSMVDAEGSRALFEEVTVEDKEIRLFDGYYHEIFNDVGKEQALDALAVWIENRA